MKWKAEIIKHRKQSRIAVYFEKDPDLIARIKKLDGALWSVTRGVWHLPDTPEYRERFKIPPLIIPDEGHLRRIEDFRMWLASKRYSPSTINTYTDALKSFFTFL